MGHHESIDTSGHTSTPTANTAGLIGAQEAKYHDDTVPIHGDGRPQVFHGAFSDCSCHGCLEDAKKEAEKRFDSNNLAFNYIKKLEALVNQLQMDANDDYYDGIPTEVYHDGRMRRRSSVDAGVPFAFGKSVGAANPARPLDTSEAVVAAAVDGDEAKDYQGPKVEIKRMKKLYDQFGNQKTERDRTTPNTSTSANLSNEYVLSIFREFDRKKNYWRRVVEIRSPSFIELLRHVAHSNVDLPASDDILRLKEPLMPLFHNRTSLVEYLQTGTSDHDDKTSAETKAHTKLILGFMENECQDLVKVQKDLETRGSSAVIQYEHAWLLYAPGTIVFSKENGEFEAFVVESIRGCQKHQPSINSRSSHSSMEITCWSINYDGEIFGRVWSTHYVAPFEGLKEIASMELLPEPFVPDIDAVKASLIERGQNFWALQGQCFREYAGEVWSSHMDEDHIRVMVDHLTYQKRSDWPIEIDRKRGPANAQSKNWRENRFTRGRRVTPAQPSDRPPQKARPMRQNHAIYAHGDDRDYSPDRYNNQDQYEDAYERVDCDRPPQAGNAFFKKYDVLKPESELDELAKLLCPQIVHGYCLRDKVWSKYPADQCHRPNADQDQRSLT